MRTAVLLIAFKRYEETEAVFEAIRAARPPRFYFACDGARPDREGEQEAVDKVRSLAQRVDWPCEFKTRFSDTNQSVRFGPPAAIDWFFAHEEEGIIMEDDCLAHPTWWRFAQEMLEHFRHDERVWAIIGNNLMPEWPARNNESYYYSSHGYGAYWGWASWRRTWKLYDLGMQEWPALRDSGLLNGHFLNRSERTEAFDLFEESWNGGIHSWDFQLDYGRWMHGMVNVIPTVNQVRNIGFSGTGTNTLSDVDPRNKSETADMPFPLKHPRFFLVDRERDLVYFKRFIEPSTYRKLKLFVKGLLPSKVDKALTPHVGRIQRKLRLH